LTAAFWAADYFFTQFVGLLTKFFAELKKRGEMRVTSPPDWGFKSHSRALLKKIF
jgi:hypothetical protein